MKQGLVQLIARNARMVRDRMPKEAQSYRAIAKESGLAPNTVKHVFEPETRALGKKGEASVQIDSLDKLAKALGFEGWQLMQEDFDPLNPPTLILKKNEAELHRRIEEAYRQLPPDPLNGKD